MGEQLVTISAVVDANSVGSGIQIDRRDRDSKSVGLT